MRIDFKIDGHASPGLNQARILRVMLAEVEMRQESGMIIKKKTFLLTLIAIISCNKPDEMALLKDRYYEAKQQNAGIEEIYPILEEVYNYENGKLIHILDHDDYRIGILYELSTNHSPYPWLDRALNSRLWQGETFEMLCDLAKNQCEKPRQNLCLMALANMAKVSLSLAFPKSGTWEEEKDEILIQTLQCYQYQEKSILKSILQQLKDGVSICDLVFEEPALPCTDTPF